MTSVLRLTWVLLVSGLWGAIPVRVVAAPVGYTIAQIFAEPGLTGYRPEQVQWSPDGRHLTYLLRHRGAPQADLYIVDVGTGKTSLLLSSTQLAGAAAPPSAIKNPLEQERITRYHIDRYHWSPRSDAIFFMSDQQIYLYKLHSHRIIQITHEPGNKRDPQLSPDEQWVSYVTHGVLHYASLQGGHSPRSSGHPWGPRWRVGLGIYGGAGVALRIYLGTGQSLYCIPAV